MVAQQHNDHDDSRADDHDSTSWKNALLHARHEMVLPILTLGELREKVLMHFDAAQEGDACQAVYDWCVDRGYQFISVSDIHQVPLGRVVRYFDRSRVRSSSSSDTVAALPRARQAFLVSHGSPGCDDQMDNKSTHAVVVLKSGAVRGRAIWRVRVHPNAWMVKLTDTEVALRSMMSDMMDAS